MKTGRSALAGIVLLAWSAAALATASNKELEARADETDARLAAVERANQTLVQVQQQAEALRQELRTLRGQIDEARHELEGLQRQQRDLYSDLDRRLLLIENGAAPGAQGAAPVDRRPGIQAPAGPASTSGTVAAAGTNGPAAPGSAPTEEEIRAADETTIYSDAFAALKAGRYDEAARGFQLYVTKYPDGPRADYATYWLGETFYVQKDYVTALKLFQKVLATFPDSRKAPDAMLKVAYTQYELKAFRNARATLQKVVAAYPGTDAQRLAEQRLVQMDSEGR